MGCNPAKVGGALLESGLAKPLVPPCYGVVGICFPRCAPQNTCFQGPFDQTGPRTLVLSLELPQRCGACRRDTPAAELILCTSDPEALPSGGVWEPK